MFALILIWSIKFAFLVEGKYGLVLIVPQSAGLFLPVLDLKAGHTRHVLRAIGWETFTRP